MPHQPGHLHPFSSSHHQVPVELIPQRFVLPVFFPNILQSKDNKYASHRNIRENERTEIVISATPVLSSPLFPIAASFTSANDSGKLLRHTARRECIPSLSSFPSLSLRTASEPRRARRPSHKGCNAKRDSYDARARKVCLCSDRLMSAIREDMISLKSVNKGLRRVL